MPLSTLTKFCRFPDCRSLPLEPPVPGPDWLDEALDEELDELECGLLELELECVLELGFALEL